MTYSDLPTLNAILNSMAAFLLLGGRWAIKQGRRTAHIRFMVAALIMSAAFLVSYLAYHAQHLTTRYTGEGMLRAVYFAVLVTHIPLAGLMVPFILAAVWFAWRGRFDRHVALVRWVWPVWMYVSVTGVVIYLMLYVF